MRPAFSAIFQTVVRTFAENPQSENRGEERREKADRGTGYKCERSSRVGRPFKRQRGIILGPGLC